MFRIEAVRAAEQPPARRSDGAAPAAADALAGGEVDLGSADVGTSGDGQRNFTHNDTSWGATPSLMILVYYGLTILSTGYFRCLASRI